MYRPLSKRSKSYLFTQHCTHYTRNLSENAKWLGNGRIEPGGGLTQVELGVVKQLFQLILSAKRAPREIAVFGDLFASFPSTLPGVGHNKPPYTAILSSLPI